MKLLMICHDLTVKQYHLACALKDVLGYECTILHTKTSTYDYWNALKGFPNFKYMYGKLIRNKAHFAITRYRENPFETIAQFSEKKAEDIAPDLIYTTSASLEASKKALNLETKAPIILDVEDSRLLTRDFSSPDKYMERIAIEYELVSNPKVKIVLWGSDEERRAALQNYKPSGKSFITIYPFVARRTLPKKLKRKTRGFTAVYIGSIWTGRNYRNYFPSIERMCKTNLPVTIYMLNSWDRLNWKIASNLERKYTNITLKKFVPYDVVKEIISEFHVGISGDVWGFAKTKATYGMKPLEYAYAGVQPVSIGHPIRNLSDGEEFGYCSPLETIEENYRFNLRRFDRDHHLMDNHLNQIKSEIEETL